MSLTPGRRFLQKVFCPPFLSRFLPLLRVTVTQCGQIALTHLSTTAVACMPYLTQESLSDQPSQCKPDVKETPSTFLRQGEDDL